ncbi:MAG TPA: hypothetical protein VIM29_09370, partial [Bacillota bacterium]
MLKETLVNKYFKNAWKSQIFVERFEKNYYVTDKNVILKLPLNATLFNDRAMFPELPEDGKCFAYSKVCGIIKDGSSSVKLVRPVQQLLSCDLSSVNVTP